MGMGHWGRVVVHRLAFRHLFGLDIMYITALFGHCDAFFSPSDQGPPCRPFPSVCGRPANTLYELSPQSAPACVCPALSQITQPHGFARPPETLTNPRLLQRFLLIAKAYGDDRKLVLENTIALVHIGPMMLPSKRSPAASTHTARQTPRLRFAASGLASVYEAAWELSSFR